MSTTFNGFRFVLPASATELSLPVKAGSAVSVGDLLCWDATNNVCVPANESVVGVSDTVANIAANFCGVALAGVLAADTSGGYPAFPNIQAISVASDACYLADIASTNLVKVGSKVGPVVGSSSSVALNSTTAQVIGYCIADYNGQTVTQIRVRLVSKFSPFNYADVN
jgi:hypothetical protein